MDLDFPSAFRIAQAALGLTHYRIHFERAELAPDFADIAPEPSRCFAHCRYDEDALTKSGETVAIATHEALHLLLADLVHSCAHGEKIAAIEEERVVIRLESIVARSIFRPASIAAI